MDVRANSRGHPRALYAGEITPLEEFVNTDSQNHLTSMVHMQSGVSASVAAAVESDSGDVAPLSLGAEHPTPCKA